MQQEQNFRMGVTTTLSSYLIWGFLPLYWALLSFIPALDVLMYRISFAFLFMVILLIFARRKAQYINEIKNVFTQSKLLMQMIFAAIFISLNWFLFIFAVSSNMVLEASLAYYINPLLNVVLATVIIKETLSRAEVFAVSAAGVGVLILIVFNGTIPWAAFGMALSFCFYGFIKRSVSISATAGLFIETALVTPIALLYLLFFTTYSIFTMDSSTILLLSGAGIFTAVPLILFSFGAKHIPFSLVGFFQYIAPTTMLFLGIFIFKEPFSLVQFIAFLFIWIGLLTFTSSKILSRRKGKEPLTHE
ncbi:EamA family transporter RarD [Shouchella miscanthi]|uniref:EamA family transporter RarD n=1 Tax=Shouchella miscanthi TaxID=2598861 RepID=UPI0011A17332|nr:EamA family transporter RarD [Shouchella miscanthi]